jgi:hypothetical protein
VFAFDSDQPARDALPAGEIGPEDEVSALPGIVYFCRLA